MITCLQVINFHLRSYFRESYLVSFSMGFSSPILNQIFAWPDGFLLEGAEVLVLLNDLVGEGH